MDAVFRRIRVACFHSQVWPNLKWEKRLRDEELAHKKTGQGQVTPKEGRDALREEKRDWGGREAASNGVTRCSVKAFQFHSVGNAKKMKPSK